MSVIMERHIDLSSTEDLGLPFHNHGGVPSFVSKESHTGKENTTGRWTPDEHQLFLEGLKLYKKQWKQIADLIKTRTVVQIRTHAQKYFQKLMKTNKTDEYDDSFLQEFISTNPVPPSASVVSSNNILKSVSLDESEDFSVPHEKKNKRSRSDLGNTTPRPKKAKLTVSTKPGSPKSVSEPTSIVGHHFFPHHSYHGLNHIDDDGKHDFDVGETDWFPDSHHNLPFFDHPFHVAHNYNPSYYSYHPINYHPQEIFPTYDYPVNSIQQDPTKFDDFELAWLAEATSDNALKIASVVHDPNSQKMNNVSKNQTVVITPESSEHDDKSTGDSLSGLDNRDGLAAGKFVLDKSKVLKNGTDSSISINAIPEITPVPVVRKRGRPKRAPNSDEAVVSDVVYTTKVFTPSLATRASNVPHLESIHSVWDDDEAMGGLLDPFA